MAAKATSALWMLSALGCAADSTCLASAVQVSLVCADPRASTMRNCEALGVKSVKYVLQRTDRSAGGRRCRIPYSLWKHGLGWSRPGCLKASIKQFDCNIGI